MIQLRNFQLGDYNEQFKKYAIHKNYYELCFFYTPSDDIKTVK